MKNTFALVTEGRTDQTVIENILMGYFNNSDIIVHRLQPSDATDESRYSNWGLVFKCCKSEEFKGAFQYNEYIIIHIDTDVSEEKHYDIPKNENEKKLSPEELIDKIIEKFRGLIGEDFYTQNQDKIIFAIAVDSTECWLLPLHCPTKKESSFTNNCLFTLKKALAKKKGFGNYEKNPDYYEIISRDYRKNKILMTSYKENPSFKIFIEEIEKRNIAIERDEEEN